MTVANTSSRKTFTGDGVTTSFATSPVVFFETSNLVVSVVTTATGAATTLTENTHYTVSGGGGSTGTVDLSGGSAPYGAPSAAQTLVIVRDLPLTQSADPDNGDNSDAEVIEEAADRLTMMVQQLQRQIDGAFRLADTDVSGADATIPTPAASKLIGWDDAGTALQNYAAADIDLALVSAFAETLLDDSTATEARTTLGAASTSTATTTAAGLIELAIQAEVDAGTDTDRAIAPFRLTSWTPTTATIDLANDMLIVRDATDSKIRKMAPSGVITQIVTDLDAAVATGTTAIPYDDSIPQITEGDEYFSVSITPKSAASTLLIFAIVHCGHSAANQMTLALFKDAGADAIAVSSDYLGSTSGSHTMALNHKRTSGGTSAQTFSLRMGSTTGATTTVNGQAGGRKYGGALCSGLIVIEVLP